jgi:creatinine amidohydrolase
LALEWARRSPGGFMKRIGVTVFLLLLGITPVRGQSKLSVKWEELTAEDFRVAIQQAKGTCLLPFGILEKHGPHLPLGTDLLNVRFAALHAAEQEFAVVFPEYYFGQIFEAKHEPGTVAYSMELQLKLLQETTDEMARNGCKKVVIVNGHGGNERLLPYFAQAQMAGPKDYVVYVLDGARSRPGGPAKKSAGVDYHAGENETSNTLYTHPELTHIDRAGRESGADQKRQNLPDFLYTGIWWYARFPQHYSGDGSVATQQLGEWNVQGWISTIVEAIRAVKADDASLHIQNEFYEKSKHPLDTPQ